MSSFIGVYKLKKLALSRTPNTVYSFDSSLVNILSSSIGKFLVCHKPLGNKPISSNTITPNTTTNIVKRNLLSWLCQSFIKV